MSSLPEQVEVPLTLHKEDQVQTPNENNASEGGISGSTFVAQHMDITEPLSTLRLLLEDRLGTSLSDYIFLLQDAQQLEDSKNLVEQCVEGEGLVQINVELSNKNGLKKINIIDVLKPAEEIIALVSQPVAVNSQPVYLNYECSEEPTKWGSSTHFRQMQANHNIPSDPMLWTKEHVDLWLHWAIEHFNLTNVLSKNTSWNLDGPGICSMTQEEFTLKIPIDPGNLFWTHFELLRKYKFIAVPTPTMNQAAVLAASSPPPTNKRPLRPQKSSSSSSSGSGSSTESSTSSTPSNRLGYNGQYQLWQFLLELLTDKDQCQYIQWVGEEGEFKLLEPETVAHMWGRRKNKPYMNYEKLSRALRYYYDGEMIAKVHGKRFVYKFVCDLKSMLGYSAAELDKLVTECRMKCMQQGGGVQNGSISPGGSKMKAEPSA